MKPDTHEIHLIAEPGHQIVSFTIHCGWAALDPERPCWPCDEYGTPFQHAEGRDAGCVFVDWVSEDGIEAFEGPPRVLRFDLASARWTGDNFQFTLGALLGEGQLVIVGPSEIERRRYWEDELAEARAKASALEEEVERLKNLMAEKVEGNY